MFCGKCGKENVDGARFCKGCGSPLFKDEGKGGDQDAPAQSISQPTAPQNVQENAGQSAPISIKLIAGVIAAIAAIILIIFVVSSRGKTINMNDFLTFEEEGYDGYGHVSVSIDWDALERKYGDKLKFTSAAKQGAGGLLQMVQPIDAIKESVSVSLEKNSGLANGDVINYTWNVDEEVSKIVNCKLKYKDDAYTVSRLEKIGSFDAFAGVTVDFSGTAPNGTANLNYTGSEMNYYDFSIDKTSGLSNGDIVKVTINEANMERFAQNLGKLPESMEKTYTVDGLESYLKGLNEIDDAAMEAMKQQAKDVYDAYLASSWNTDSETLESFTYIGDYLLIPKNTDSRGNVLYLVYKVQAHDKYKNEDGDSYNKINDIYWFVGYKNLMVGPDGKVVVNVTNYDTPSEKVEFDSGVKTGWWGTQKWNYYGYPSLDVLYKKVVMSNANFFNHEDNVDESLAPTTVNLPGPEPEREEENEESEDNEDTDDEDSEARADENSYILPHSDTKKITTKDLEGLTKEEIKIARNEIYARHGRRFKDKDLQKHFDACDWYEGTIDPGDFDDEKELSKIERENRDTIVKYEKSL